MLVWRFGNGYALRGDWCFQARVPRLGVRVLICTYCTMGESLLTLFVRRESSSHFPTLGSLCCCSLVKRSIDMKIFEGVFNCIMNTLLFKTCFLAVGLRVLWT